MTTNITTAKAAFAEVRRAREVDERPNLRWADLRGADLRDADLLGADLRDADLLGADLRDADLLGADLRGANLRWADLSGSGLRDTNLRMANLYEASLRWADLRGADLRWINLRGTNLHGADGGILQISDFPSGQVVAVPTPDGWRVFIGCWSGTPAELIALCDAPDEKWPEARDEERQRREPILRAAHALIEAHITYHAGLIEDLAEKWKKDEK